jgi:hypothetical protein
MQAFLVENHRIFQVKEALMAYRGQSYRLCQLAWSFGKGISRSDTHHESEGEEIQLLIAEHC